MTSYQKKDWIMISGISALAIMVGVTAISLTATPKPKTEMTSARRFVPLRENLVLTSRVNPDDLGWDDKMELGYDGIAGDQICRTKLREYCVEEGNCDWYVDYYIAKSPRVCPVEPIE